jgi:hypothetical protein
MDRLIGDLPHRVGHNIGKEKLDTRKREAALPRR